MKAAVLPPKSKESSSRTSVKPLFAKSADGTFFASPDRSTPFFAPATIQTKLAVGRPGDRYEQEADAMANQVVQRLGTDTTIQARPLASSLTPLVQTKCAHCEEEERLQRKERSDAPVSSTGGLQSQLMASRGAGSPLSKDTRTSMEQAFGTDFGGVRIHTNSQAVQMSQDLQAQAFTHGNDIYFNEGKYNPATTSGQHLLAHELTHTIQQGASQAPAVQADLLDDVGDFAGDVYDTAVDTASDAIDTAVDAGEAAVGTVVDAAGAVVDAGSQAVDWIMTEAGQAALAIVSLFGGIISMIGTEIVITIPDVTLFDSFQQEIGELPAIPLFIMPIFAAPLGPIDFLATLEVNATPSLLAAIGPGALRNIYVSLDVLSGTIAGHAELYVAAALGGRLSLFGGIVGRGIGVIPIEPPIPIEASLEGGIRGTGTLWGIGALNEMLDVSLGFGGWSFSANTDLMLGLLLQGDVDLYAAAKIFELLVCEYAYPLGHWETGAALNINIPMSIGSGGFVIGPVTLGEIPIEDIETAIEPLEYGLHCLGLDEIIAELCESGKLPEEVCEILIDPDSGQLVGPLAVIGPCENLPAMYEFKSYRAAEQELKRRAGIPSGTQLYRNDKKATAGPCVGIGRHYNVWDNPGKRGQPVGAIGMCPCTIIDKAGKEIKTERYAVLNPRADLAIDPSGVNMQCPSAKQWETMLCLRPGDFHRSTKPGMLQDHSSEIRRANLGNNPDVCYNKDTDNLIFKSRTNSNTLETTTSFGGYSECIA